MQVLQQKYYNMQTFNKPYEVGEEVLKKIMADESCKAIMKTKWIGPYAQVSARGV